MIQDESTISDTGSTINQYPYFTEAIKHITNKNVEYDLRKIIKHDRKIDSASYMLIFGNADESIQRERLLSLSKKQLEELLYEIPKLIEIFSETKLTPIIKLRYRKYVFRILYLLWQDYYDKPRFSNLFLYVLNHPKSQNYVQEVNFTVETLRGLVLARQIENKFMEQARFEQMDLREFLNYHKISRESVIAMDVMGIFFLFCSAQEYIEIGSERLIIVLMRSNIKNQAKILNNILRKLSSEETILLKDVFYFFKYKYSSPAADAPHEFWTLTSSNTKEEILNIFTTFLEA